MAEQGNAPDPGLDRAQLQKYIVPVVGGAAVVVLVGLVVVYSGTSHAMSDGSDGTAKDPGLIDLAPGVRYRDVKAGTGETCTREARATLHYTGWLEDGTEFDTSRKPGGRPFTFRPSAGGAIKGWIEGVPGMKVGGVRKLVIAPEMGYGDRENGRIPPNSTLIFEVELASVSVPMTAGAGQPMPSDQSNGGTDDPGLKDLGGGLKYRDLKVGEGEPVKDGGTVTVHYTGWLPDGKVFDTSHKGKDAPASFGLGGVIQGWTRGVPGMKPGGIRKLVIPSDLGYGEKGNQDIPGGATLIFEIELVK